MYRYLLNISYIGTSFRGAQRQVKYTDIIKEDKTTVQGNVELGLRKLYPINDISVATSSRTDSGVHALHSTMHVDLQRSNNASYPTHIVTATINKYFHYHELPIRILNTFIVPDTFHCRHASSRTYMYRLCIINSEIANFKYYMKQYPIEEHQRCLFLCTNSFDINKMREAAQLFLGDHDFRTFMNKGSKDPDKITRRTIDLFEVHEVPINSYSKYSWPSCINNRACEYKFYHIYIKSSGFLYKQVRRSVAALIGAALHKVTLKDINFMLQIPSHNSWDSRLKTVPAHGLYLCEVAYPENITSLFKV